MMLWLLGSDPPIQQVIDCGVVPCFIRFLQIDDNPALQLEAAGAIAGIANSDASDHVRYLIEAGVVPILLRLLSSPNYYVRALVAGGLGGIADDNAEYRDILLAGCITCINSCNRKL